MSEETTMIQKFVEWEERITKLEKETNANEFQKELLKKLDSIKFAILNGNNI